MVYYQTELCDLNNPEEAKFISDFLYTCTRTDGQIGINPLINLFYFKNNGNKEQLKKAQENYNDFIKKADELRKTLKTKLKENPELKETQSDIFYSAFGMKHQIIAKRANKKIEFYLLPFL